jgi:hypothetical protein
MMETTTEIIEETPGVMKDTPNYEINLYMTTTDGTRLMYPEDKLRKMLLVVAKKLKKPVNFYAYKAFDDIRWEDSIKSINIYAPIVVDRYSLCPIYLGNDKYIDIITTQSWYTWSGGIDGFMKGSKNICVGVHKDSIIIAGVQNNNLLVILNCLCEDNPGAQEIFSWILNESIPFLKFDKDYLIKDMINKLSSSYKNMIDTRIETVSNELDKQKREANDAKYIINSYESQKPIIESELTFLYKIRDRGNITRFRKQAKSLLSLIKSGGFADIKVESDGVVAITNPINIKYNGYTFKMGQYKININYKDYAKPIIFSRYGTHPPFSTNYLHPHITGGGEPCFGSIRSISYKLCNSLRINELLPLLHEFLCSYNPDNPYSNISNFDVDGEYEGDESDDPCDDCDDLGTPYCVRRCSYRDGDYECNEYRSNFCYEECEYNSECGLSPCDDCGDRGGDCFDNCRYNEDWNRRNPCEDCNNYNRCNEINGKHELVEGEDTPDNEEEKCDYYEDAIRLGFKTAP